jgi:RNA polymerase sigma factor (sigma-70 family)
MAAVEEMGVSPPGITPAPEEEKARMSAINGEAESTLVRHARAGDRSALEQLIERHYEGVRAEGFRLLRDSEAAQELAQEVFVLATLHLRTLREDERFGGWVRTIARNLARTWIRSQRRSAALATQVMWESTQMEAIADPKGRADDALAGSQENERLTAALAKLEPDERALILQHFMQQESQRSIAEQHGVHHTTISRRIESTLARLRQMLGAPHGVVGTKALCVATLALPIAARTRLAEQSAAEIARLSLPFWMQLLHPNLASIATGAIAVTTTKKIVLVAATFLLIGSGAVYQSGLLSGVATPDRVVPFTTGKEVTIPVANGETVRVAFDTIAYPQNDMAKYVTDYATADITTDGGNVTLVLTKRDGSSETKNFRAGAPTLEPLVSYHIWQEMNLLLLTSAIVRPTATGVDLVLFRANRPDLLPQAKELERQRDSGRLSAAAFQTSTKNLLEKNGMLPQDPQNRTQLLNALAGE